MFFPLLFQINFFLRLVYYFILVVKEKRDVKCLKEKAKWKGDVIISFYYKLKKVHMSFKREKLT